MTKVLVIGHAQHGKDTVKDSLAGRWGLKTMNVSLFAVETFIYSALAPKYGYLSHQQCYENRHGDAMRQEWADLFDKYCGEDKARFVRECLTYTDVYAGIRHRDQFEAARPLFDLVLWVDASKRKPIEPTLELTEEDSDWILDNNLSKTYLYLQIDQAMKSFGVQTC